MCLLGRVTSYLNLLGTFLTFSTKSLTSWKALSPKQTRMVGHLIVKVRTCQIYCFVPQTTSVPSMCYILRLTE